MKLKKMTKNALVLSSIFLLSACSNPEKSLFVDQCIAKQKSKDECECTYDLARDSLEDNQYELFAASFLGDKSRQAKIQASLGMLGLATAGTRIAWLAANLDDACMNQ